jgi:hypothetical protein
MLTLLLQCEQEHMHIQMEVGLVQLQWFKHVKLIKNE